MSLLKHASLYLLAALAFAVRPGVAGGAPLVDPACDTDNDGIVDGLPADYAEGQQYGNLLNFYAVTMGASPLHAAVPVPDQRLLAGLELSYIPQLSCTERAVFAGYKTEHTNKSPVFPRLHVTYGLPGGVYLGLSGLPPVPAFGVRTGVIAGELGAGRVLGQRFELGARTALLFGHVTGDLAGPLPNQVATDDTYDSRVWSIEGMAGLRLPTHELMITPYLGAGYTRVNASMYIGEDQVEVPGAQGEMGRMRYRGPHGELGAQVSGQRLTGALEVYLVPLNIVDPGNPRFFASPRLQVGYTFF